MTKVSFLQNAQFAFWLFFYFWWDYKLSIFNAYHTARATFDSYQRDDFFRGDLVSAIRDKEKIRDFALSCVDEEVSCWDNDE